MILSVVSGRVSNIQLTFIFNTNFNLQAGVTAALGVKAAMEKHNIRGRVRLLGTPAEETLGGKRPMLERGAFDGLDACMMIHPAQFDVLYRQPLGVGRLEIEYRGKAAHASSSPWEGKEGREMGNECSLFTTCHEPLDELYELIVQTFFLPLPSFQRNQCSGCDCDGVQCY
jgi:acetylornithine deacetylase/succinyl-diaminopimelate desuccinylase-like protein